MPNGNGGGDGGGGFDFGSIFDGLLGALAAIVQAIIDFLYALVNALVQVLNFLFQGELGIFDFSNKGLESIWHGLKNIMDQVFKVWVVGALKHLLDLYKKLQEWAKKLKVWLDKLRKLQQLYQVQAMKRFINLIQRIRKILVIFRLLHLKFASKLDNWLAGIEGKLILRQQQIQSKTNEIIAWINLVADPTTLFRQVPLLKSLGRGMIDLFNAINALGLTKIFPQLAQVKGPGVPARPWAEVAHQFHTEAQDNTGDWGAFNRQALSFGEQLDQGFSTNR